jgi:CrcB protein
MNVLWVILGALVGAPLRYLTDRTVQSRHGGVFPWGTFVVNMVASIVLGSITGAVAAGVTSHQIQLLLGTGLCATLSTYSTFSYESVRMAEEGTVYLAVANVVASVVVGVGAAYLGVEMTHAIWG